MSFQNEILRCSLTLSVPHFPMKREPFFRHSIREHFHFRLSFCFIWKLVFRCLQFSISFLLLFFFCFTLLTGFKSHCNKFYRGTWKIMETKRKWGKTFAKNVIVVCYGMMRNVKENGKGDWTVVYVEKRTKERMVVGCREREQGSNSRRKNEKKKRIKQESCE